MHKKPRFHETDITEYTEQNNRYSVCKQKSLFDFQLSHKYFACLKMYKILKSNAHPYFQQKILSFQIAHSHYTRSMDSELLTVPRMNFVKCQRSFLSIGTNYWNQLPLVIRNSETFKQFKRELKNYIFF